MRLTYLICTFFYVGRLRPAPGTWGSLAALPVAWALHLAGGPALLFAGILLSFTLGWWATHLETKGKDNHDPSEIVIDEVAGQWLAFLPVSIGASHAGADLLNLWPGFVFSFAAFRFFDITKLGPIGWADRRNDALGVMLDDIVAGFAAALCVLLAAGLYHGVLGL
ncbi:phosphatidylglycerophosphatase A [uncultured Roseovarius sp.]|uniref:phosphatidylglycerophosphatase A family protein n=1 Tax=uncultured Roseovarius sp. TaxID=293344 RepID=UPI000C560F20|nr:phosphatidylglycerophosphatase [Roseovarius sp.]MBD13398.1 phosphatidylglycerophosphatase [Roseovarius sp.]